MSKKYKRVILVAMSDPHGGHKLGLLNPKTVLWDEDGNDYHPTLNKTQQYLWKVYMTAKEEVVKLAGKDEIVLLSLGDLSQGDKYLSEQISTRMSDQIQMAVWGFEPWVKLPNVKKVRIAKGTGSHSFGEGSTEILVGSILGEKYNKKNIKVLDHGLANIGGLSVDYAHHGPYPGSRNWLQGNVARYYLRSLMQDEINAGEIPPDLVLRGHYHTYIKELLNIQANGLSYESMLCILPSMCMPGNWTRQATRSVSRITNGVIAFEILDGKIYQAHKFTSTLDIRTREKL